MTVLPQIKNFINGQWRATETQFQPQNPATPRGHRNRHRLGNRHGLAGRHVRTIDLPIRGAARRPEWRN
jgi:hypothetical protein